MNGLAFGASWQRGRCYDGDEDGTGWIDMAGVFLMGRRRNRFG